MCSVQLCGFTETAACALLYSLLAYRASEPCISGIFQVIACLDVRTNDKGDLVVTKGDQYDVRENTEENEVSILAYCCLIQQNEVKTEFVEGIITAQSKRKKNYCSDPAKRSTNKK